MDEPKDLAALEAVMKTAISEFRLAAADFTKAARAWLHHRSQADEALLTAADALATRGTVSPSELRAALAAHEKWGDEDRASRRARGDAAAGVRNYMEAKVNLMNAMETLCDRRAYEHARDSAVEEMQDEDSVLIARTLIHGTGLRELDLDEVPLQKTLVVERPRRKGEKR